MAKYDLLLADADGTLMDFETAEAHALRDACAVMGVPLDEAKAARYSEINEELWRAFERREVTQAELRVLRFARFFDEMGIALDAVEMADCFVLALSKQNNEIPGAHAFLREAAARVPVVIVTNGIARVQRSRFGLSRLGRYVKGYVISGECGFAKPDPRMIERGLMTAGAAPDRALMLGDEPLSDIAAANAAGVDCCWFNPTGRANKTAHRPTYEVANLCEVLAWL